MRASEHTILCSGNAIPGLARSVAAHLQLPLAAVQVGRFSDLEIQVEILENVRGRDVFVFQSLAPPVNDHLMELLILVDALRRASAGRITAVMPYFAYARQDRRLRAARVPITAKLIANMLTVSGVNRVLTVDVHSEQIQGFFDIPFDNVYASPVLLSDLWRRVRDGSLVVVSPDVGGVARARALAKRLDDADLAIIDKRRPRPNEAEVMNVIGEVEGRTCVIVDDIVDTAGTLTTAASVLKSKGATRVVAYITHPVLSGPAVERIAASALDELVVTDTLPLQAQAAACPKIRQLSIAQLLAETVRRIHEEESVSSLYVD
jgi:ribose-phosphate pyrophosphokinase